MTSTPPTSQLILVEKRYRSVRLRKAARGFSWAPMCNLAMGRPFFVRTQPGGRWPHTGRIWVPGVSFKTLQSSSGWALIPAPRHCTTTHFLLGQLQGTHNLVKGGRVWLEGASSDLQPPVATPTHGTEMRKDELQSKNLLPSFTPLSDSPWGQKVWKSN